MAVDWNAEVLDQVQTHWDGQLRPRLEGLTDEELVWEPFPEVTTIAWRLGRRRAQPRRGRARRAAR
jgi:hypothetical protein